MDMGLLQICPVFSILGAISPVSHLYIYHLFHRELQCLSSNKVCHATRFQFSFGSCATRISSIYSLWLCHLWLALDPLIRLSSLQNDTWYGSFSSPLCVGYFCVDFLCSRLCAAYLVLVDNIHLWNTRVLSYWDNLLAFIRWTNY